MQCLGGQRSNTMERIKRIRLPHILALATITFFALGTGSVNAEVGIGAIVIDTSIEGKGSFETNGGINVGDTITTGEKGNVTILFDDESMLTLGPNAKAQVVQYSQTPPPGISEIKILSGGFRYFPGDILENGGKQVLNNIGGTSVADSPQISTSELVLDAAAQQPDFETLSDLNNDISSIVNEISLTDVTSGVATPDTGGNPGIPGGGPNVGDVRP